MCPLSLGGRLTLPLIVLFQPSAKLYCAAGLFSFSLFRVAGAVCSTCHFFCRRSLKVIVIANPTPCQDHFLFMVKPTKHSFQ